MIEDLSIALMLLVLVSHFSLSAIKLMVMGVGSRRAAVDSIYDTLCLMVSMVTIMILLMLALHVIGVALGPVELEPLYNDV